MAFTMISPRREESTLVKIDVEIQFAFVRGELGGELAFIFFVDRAIKRAELFLDRIVKRVQFMFQNATVRVCPRSCVAAA